MCYPEFPNLGRFFQIGGKKPGSSFMNVSRSTLQKLPAVNYYHKALHVGCCSSPRSGSTLKDQNKNAQRSVIS